MATNGALIHLKAGDAGPGDTVRMPSAGTLKYRATLRANFPVDHLEVIWNGRVVASLNTGADRRAADVSGEVPSTGSGWLLLRAWNDGPDADVLDIYPVRHDESRSTCVSRDEPRRSARCRDLFSAVARSDSRGDRTECRVTGPPPNATAVLQDVARARAFYEQCLREASGAGQMRPRHVARLKRSRSASWHGSRVRARAIAIQRPSTTRWPGARAHSDPRTGRRRADARRRATFAPTSSGRPEGRFPTLVYRTPYGRRDALEEYTTFTRAVERGYAVVVQDVRGRYASDGEFRPYENEGRDGYDTIEWAARQPWSNGRVGTFGLSYPGAVQWLAAVENPPHLEAMVPAMTFSTPQNFFYSGGIWDLSWVQWIWASIAPDARVKKGLPAPAGPAEAPDGTP